MPRLFLAFTLLAFALTSFGGAAWAGPVDVAPVRVHLSKTRKSETLTVRNRNRKRVRYQIVPYAWTQSAKGEMQLSPTKDLVVYPTLFEVKPKSTQRIKVATKVKPGKVERAYRLVLEPLPENDPDAGTINILTRINLPVFVEPKNPRPSPELRVRVADGELHVSVRNTGNAHFVSRHVQLFARNGKGEVVLQHVLKGWYVLAGGERRYVVPLPEKQCAVIRSIRATLKTDHGVRRRSIVVKGACRE